MGENIEIGTKVLVKLRNRKNLSEAIIIKIVEKPIFKCVTIDEITNFYYDNKMLEIAKFTSQYYVCSFGEALSIFIPYNNQINLNKEINIKKYDSRIKLSSEQEKAFDFCEDKKQALLFAN